TPVSARAASANPDAASPSAAGSRAWPNTTPCSRRSQLAMLRKPLESRACCGCLASEFVQTCSVRHHEFTAGSAYNVYVPSLISRRQILGAVAGAPMLSLAATRATDIRIDAVTYSFEDFLYRT